MGYGFSGEKKRLLKWALWESSKVCGICKKQLPSYALATIDHIIPRAKGGGNEIENLQLAHDKCNQKKADKIDGPCIQEAD